MTQTLTLEQVKAAARDYYDRGRLGAQMPNAPSGCKYVTEQDGEQYRCGIGAALSDETIQLLGDANARRVTYLMQKSLIVVSPEEKDRILNIQNIHDMWQSMPHIIHEQNFLRLIDHSSHHCPPSTGETPHVEKAPEVQVQVKELEPA